jgi:hypothetical protein
MIKTPADKFIQAIALVESNDNPNAPLGDHGRAAGRFQQHPTFYEQWHIPISRGTNPTWDQCFEWALLHFYSNRPGDKSDADVAVAYHLHGYHRYVEDDPEYRAKFEKALLTVSELCP